MKKIIFTLISLIVALNVSAQGIEIYENGVHIKTYENTTGKKYKVIFTKNPKADPDSDSDPNLLPGEFSVSATKKVRFTKGNLQATYSTSTSSYTWGFAANQWDYLGSTASNQGNTTINSQQNGKVVDLFGWSTTAKNSNWGLHTMNTDDYIGGDFKDWGGLVPSKNYSTLSRNEWTYLLNTTNETSGARTQTNRFAKAMVNGVVGLLIFPDNYGGTTVGTGIAAVNTTNVSFPTSSIPTDTWASMESAGVVFLPAAGLRSQSQIVLVGEGSYWYSLADGSSTGYGLHFSSNSVSPCSYGTQGMGLSVRLVLSSSTSAVNVTSLTLNKAFTSISICGCESLAAIVAPDNATNKDVTWTSSNTSVATVDASGKVTGVGAGTATITATSAENSEVTATCTITVTESSTSSNLLSGEFTVAKGKTVKFTKGNLYYSSTDSQYHLESAQNVTYQTLGQTAYDATHVCHFFWANNTDWQTSGKEPWAESYSYSAQNTGDKFFCGEDNKMTVDGISGLYALSGGDDGEWNYLINTRDNASNLHKYKVAVTTSAGTVANCLIIAPDGYDYTANPLQTSYTADEWSAAEAAGLVCLPAAGGCSGSSPYAGGNVGYYWSATPYAYDADNASALFFGWGGVGPAFNNYRRVGYSLRLVKTVKKTTYEYVDLGLPSGTLWATCNVGASSPEEYGDYFAWGETTAYNQVPNAYPTTASQDWTVGSTNSGYSNLVTNNTPKTDYSWSTYKWGTGSDASNQLKYKSSSYATLEAADDAARTNMGGTWRMPTQNEWAELNNSSYTNWVWTTNYNGKTVSGYIVYKKKSSGTYDVATDLHIFLPATGLRCDSYLTDDDQYGYYWSSSLSTSDSDSALNMFFYSSLRNASSSRSRYYGLSVRAVRPKN